MMRLYSFCFSLLLCATFLSQATHACSLNPSKMFHNPDHATLDRGINIAEIWQASPRKHLLEDDIRTIKELGFSFVRLPISERWLQNTHSASQAELRCDIIALLNAGLTIVVDLHLSGDAHKAIASQEQTAALNTLEGYWNTLGVVLDGLPHKMLYLGMLNEPSRSIENWWNLQGELIARMRNRFPDNTLIASDVLGLYGELHSKEPYDDKNIFYDFHFYSPMFFTHHNAHWLNPAPDEREKTDNLRYPSSFNHNTDVDYSKMERYIEKDWNKERLANLIAAYPDKWSKRTGAKVICLEFGVLRPHVDNESRLRWLHDMKDVFAEYNIPWALWNYRGGYGIHHNGELDHGMIDALGLTPADSF